MPEQEPKSDQPVQCCPALCAAYSVQVRGGGLSTSARLADILEHDRLGHLTESAHGGQSRISLSRGRGKRVDSTLEALVWPLITFNWHRAGEAERAAEHMRARRSRRQREGHFVAKAIPLPTLKTRELTDR